MKDQLIIKYIDKIWGDFCSFQSFIHVTRSQLANLQEFITTASLCDTLIRSDNICLKQDTSTSLKVAQLHMQHLTWGQETSFCCVINKPHFFVSVHFYTSGRFSDTESQNILTIVYTAALFKTRQSCYV